MGILMEPLISLLNKLNLFQWSKMVEVAIMVLNSAQYFSNLATILVGMLFIKLSPFTIPLLTLILLSQH